MSTRSSLLRSTLAVGIIGGVVLGTREGIATFAANAFADPGQHAVSYLVVPVAVWCVLAPLALVPVAALGRLVGVGGVPFLAGALATLGVSLAVLPVLEESLAQVSAVGVVLDGWASGILVLAVSTLVVAAGVAGRATGTMLERRSVRMRRALVGGASMIGLASLGLTARLVAIEVAPAIRPLDVTEATANDARMDAPNVLLVSIDTLRADALGTYGAPAGATPALDRLAADGVTFEHATSTAPWTLPSMASILTGLYPRHHGAGAIANRRDPLGRAPLAADVPTLAATLRDAGYRTHAIVTNPYLLARSGLSRGFQSYDNLTFISEAMVSGRGNAAQWLLDHVAPQLVAGDRGEDVSDAAVRWLAGADRARPFFLWLHYVDPHGPYGARAGTRHKSFRGEVTFGAGAVALDLGSTSPDPVRLRSGEIRLGDDDKRRVRALYDDEVAEVDRQVGRVLDALAAQGLADDTLVVCVSDHGEEFWDHGGVEHGHTLYDELLHVPWLMRWPSRLPAGRRVRTVVSTVDVAPTVQELIGLPTSAALDGVSAVGAVRGADADGRAVLSENLLFAEERVALRTADAKYVRWADGREEAYDLGRDPGERRDLAGVETFVAPLAARLDALERAMPPAVVARDGAQLPAAALRALGYVQ